MHPAVLIVSSLLLAACGSRTEPPVVPKADIPPAVVSTAPVTRAPATRAPVTTAPSASPVVEVRYRIERRTTDAATADFARVVEATLTDPRGWQRAGFRLVRDDAAPYVVVIGEPAAVQQWCLPYDVALKYSCQNGPVVALNADRWRTATPKWTGTLADYKLMLVNHEVGHLLGQHHPPAPQCRTPGRPALVMSQQSTELDGCLANPWPLPAEVALAAQHEEPIAPPYEDD